MKMENLIRASVIQSLERARQKDARQNAKGYLALEMYYVAGELSIIIDTLLAKEEDDIILAFPEVILKKLEAQEDAVI